MDPGTVVWLPDGSFDTDGACVQAFGPGYHDCGSMPWQGGILVFCCPY